MNKLTFGCLDGSLKTAEKSIKRYIFNGLSFFDRVINLFIS